MTTYPDYLDPTEAKIIDKLIETILAAGYLIRVYDGEEFAHEGKLQTIGEIRPHVAATDVTVLAVWAVNFDKIGDFTLIHGNGCDVVSDWSWSSRRPGTEAIMEALAKPAGELAETFL